jgi:hypothetical protein
MESKSFHGCILINELIKTWSKHARYTMHELSEIPSTYSVGGRCLAPPEATAAATTTSKISW